MAKRGRASRGSAKQFSKTAGKVHPMNTQPAPMRGGRRA